MASRKSPTTRRFRFTRGEAYIKMLTVMRAGRLSTYIFREIGTPFVISVAIFTFVLMGGRLLNLAELVISKGVSAGAVFGLLGTLLPVFMLVTLPLGFLLGVLLGFSRLSADSEIVAMKAAGVSVPAMMRPVLLLALLVFAATAWVSLQAEPQAKGVFRDKLFAILQSRTTVGLSPQVFADEFPGITLYADHIDDRSGRLEGVFISDERAAGGGGATIFAREGQLLADPQTKTMVLRLRDGEIHRQPAKAKAKEVTYQTVQFSVYNLQIQQESPAPGELRPVKISDMSMRQLWEEAARQTDAKERANLLSEFQQRFTMALSPLLFALIGVPLGIRSHRSGRGAGFSMGLVVFLGYHALLSLCDTLTVEQGWPLATAWVPPLLFLVVGLILFSSAAREKTILPRLPLPSLKLGRD